MYIKDNRIVLTLDAGGTNFVFSAMQGYKEITEPIRLDAVSDSIQGCLDVLEHGFNLVKEQLADEPVAISFAFPGPADYERGIIGDLGNFPAFRGGVAMGPYLQQKFGIPVYINNDGNLFAYGEALAGFLPEVNHTLQQHGVTRQYRNLLGITLGTGFGGGVVLDGVLLRGDNGCGGDVWCMRNARYPQMIAEEGVSIRAVRRVYQEESGQDVEGLTPFDIYQIAEGKREGNPQAAREAFRQLGEVAGEAMVSALNIVDGVAVVDKEACKACGKCVAACPKNLIELIPYEAKHMVACSSKDKGPVTIKACSAGCIACQLCKKNCPNDAIIIEDFHARIDYEKCTGCGICKEKCPKKVIV